eukprot:14884259-Ditylum_brightwellii.AAC.1
MEDITADPDAAYTLVKSPLHGDTLQVFQNKEAIHKKRESPVFTICLAVVTKHVFPTNAYKTQKIYIWNICKALRMCLREWISSTIKWNYYLDELPIPKGVTATMLIWEELVDVLEDGVLL